jgi:hypothetical protein
MKIDKHESVTINLTREEVLEALQTYIENKLEDRGFPNLLNRHSLEDADFHGINRRDGVEAVATFFFTAPTESK